MSATPEVRYWQDVRNGEVYTRYSDVDQDMPTFKASPRYREVTVTPVSGEGSDAAVVAEFARQHATPPVAGAGEGAS